MKRILFEKFIHGMLSALIAHMLALLATITADKLAYVLGHVIIVLLFQWAGHQA
jgi:hypothetical protein